MVRGRTLGEYIEGILRGHEGEFFLRLLIFFLLGEKQTVMKEIDA